MKMRMKDAGRFGVEVRGCGLRAGATMTDTLAVVAMIAVLLMVALVLLPMFDPRGGHGLSAQTVSVTHLKDMHIAMYQYSVANHNKFPIAGAADEGVDVFGFAGGDRGTGEGAVLDNNVTASLWMMVREGAMTPEQFVNPAVVTAEADQLTLDGRGGTSPSSWVKPAQTHDFSRAENLSYSPMNMYHTAVGGDWSAVVHPEKVLMGDDNNSDWTGKPARHTNTSATGLSHKQLMEIENSRNHDGEGQSFMFGDGHVGWHTDPFVGLGGDNVYAHDEADGSGAAPFPAEVASPPTLSVKPRDADRYVKNVRERDSTLLPITGNGGGAGSLDPLD